MLRAKSEASAISFGTSVRTVAVHLGVKMADTLSFTAKMDHKSDRKSCVIPTADRNKNHNILI